MPRLTPAPSDPDDKTLAVLKAASAVFLAHGFSAATTDMIQKAAGVSKATVYARYPNKEALFVAVIEHECEILTSQVRAIEAQPGDIERTLTGLGQAYLMIVLSPVALALFRVAVAEAPRFPDIGRRFYLAGPKIISATVSRHLDRAARAGEIDIQSVGVEGASAMFGSLLRSDAHQECLTHPDARPSAARVDHWVSLAVTTFLRAFGKR